jgi:hypothetical protein
VTVGFCRELALDQPLSGSAPQASRWVLVEDNGPWGAKVPRDTNLPDSVKQWLRGLDQPHTRVHLIRRPTRGRRDGLRRVILAATPEQPELRRTVEFDVELDRIHELDVDALLANAEPIERAPWWLVCTHGSRDRCCAKWGMPVFEALRARDPQRVWQSSHLGGHRFAPTVVALPLGLMWGRLTIEQILAVDQALGRGELDGVEGLRGRVCWPPLAQAAEAALRRAEPARAIDWLALHEIVELVQRRHRVTFVERETGEPRSVELESIDLPATPTSCGDAPEPGRGLVAISWR